MNPGEGDLRPQLSTGSAWQWTSTDLTDAAEAEAVRHRLAYEADPVEFVARWQPADAAEAERLTRPLW